MFKDELNHFFYCVKTRKQKINPIYKDGNQTLKIALDIIKSSKTKKVENT